MALILRLRRALVSTSTSALRPPAPSGRNRLRLPSSPACALRPAAAPAAVAAPRRRRGVTFNGSGLAYGLDGLLEEKDDEILSDYNHWLITMEFPGPQPSREEMIETYLQTLAQAVMTEEMSEKFRGLPGVLFILPDSILYPETKEYGGDKYDNGVITPSRPCYHWGESQRDDKNGTPKETNSLP